jgi:hypothetical protein
MKKIVKNKQHRFEWPVPMRFFTHSLVGALIAIGIAVPAIALGFAIEKLEAWHVAHFTILVISLLEKTLLVVDAIAVACYVAVSTWRELKEILGLNDDDDREERS